MYEGGINIKAERDSDKEDNDYLLECVFLNTDEASFVEDALTDVFDIYIEVEENKL